MLNTTNADAEHWYISTSQLRKKEDIWNISSFRI
jgi:hypothetical protein